MTHTTIIYPFGKVAKNAIGTPSTNTYKIIERGLSIADIFYTFVARYPRLVTHDLDVAKGKPSPTQGPVVDGVAHNVGIYSILTVLFGGISIAGSAYLYKELANSAGQSSAHMFKRLKQDNTTSIINKEDLITKIKELNDNIQQVLNDKNNINNGWNKKYENILIKDDLSVEVHWQDIKMKNEDKAKGFYKSYVQPVLDKLEVAWQSLSLASFGYWILWIGVGLFTGILVNGIDAITNFFAFGIPIALGLVFPLIKLYESANNKKLQVENDFEEIARQVNFKKFEEDYLSAKQLLINKLDTVNTTTLEKANNKDAIKNTQIIVNRKKNYIYQNRLKKTAVTLIGTTVGFYTMAQYNSWLVTDFLMKVFRLDSISKALAYAGIGPTQLIIGAALIIAASLYGTYKAYKAYQGLLLEKEKKGDKSELSGKETLGYILGMLPGINLIYSLSVLLGSAFYKLYRFAKDYFTQKEGYSRADNETFSYQEQNNAENKLQSLLEQIDQKKFKLNKKDPKALAEIPELAIKGYDSPYLFNYSKKTNMWNKIKNFAGYAFAGMGGFTTGVFIVRVFFITGSAAIFLPFVAAALSNPVTVGILVAAGILYGAFKIYEYHQAKLKNQAEWLEKHQGEKLARLEKQIEIAELTLTFIEVKLRQPISVTTSPIMSDESPSISPMRGSSSPVFNFWSEKRAIRPIEVEAGHEEDNLARDVELTQLLPSHR